MKTSGSQGLARGKRWGLLLLAGVAQVSLLGSCQFRSASMSFMESVEKYSSKPKLVPFQGFQCQPGSAPGAESALPKYTRTEWVERIRALVTALAPSQAATILNDPSVFQALNAIPSEQVGRYERFSGSSAVKDQSMESIGRLAGAISAVIRGNPTLLAGFAGSCATVSTTTPMTSTCLTAYFSRLLDASFGRTTSASSLASSAVIYPERWLDFSLTYVFSSPEFLHRLELGAGNPSGGWIDLSEMDLARKLAAFLWMGVPDAQLKAWAGDSTGISGRYEQVLDYLFAHPKFESMLRNFAWNYFDLKRLPNIRLDADNNTRETAFANGWGAIVSDARYTDTVREEAIQFLVQSIKSDLSFREMFLSNASYAAAPLSTAYGLPAWTPGQPPQQHPAGTKVGPISLAAVHASGRLDKSHITTGYAMLKTFMCGTVGSPESANLPASAIRLPDLSELISSRERTHQGTSGASCAGCHSLINWPAFGAAQIDSFGTFRRTERIYHSLTGSFLGTVAVDPKVEFQFGSRSYRSESLSELAENLLDTEMPQSCFVRHFSRHFYGRDELLSGEEACALNDFFLAVRDPGTSIKDALKEFVRSNYFRRRPLGAT